ncbi:hypothetical protein QR692_10025 [Lactococcus petauri]|uniref:hypothetical protein n=1 Tax=Lactococcus petauri TaxID=1940789 RepID=UPI0020788B63|nr:hypothetical protein [Lactococcus petauri]USI65319.1 hypothetical protein LMK05_10910 [Lactococcus petauri]USI67814.1 hypothetical protein LMK04_10145 [Lactococcus petauri]WJE12475.1 hypothetical protein QR692_10025 [Lactococcus petauri]
MSDFLSGVLIGKAFSDGSGDGCGCGCWSFLFIGLCLFSAIMTLWTMITDPIWAAVVVRDSLRFPGIIIAIVVLSGVVWMLILLIRGLIRILILLTREVKSTSKTIKEGTILLSRKLKRFAKAIKKGMKR